MALPIIGGIKGCIFGRSGIGKTSLLWTLNPRPRCSSISRPAISHRGLAGRHAPAAHLEGMPGLRGVHRRAEPGAARRPALQPGAFRRGLRPFGDPRGDRATRRSSSTRSPSPGGSASSGAGPARGVLGEDRQARHPRRLRAAWPRDDRLADPPAAHAGKNVWFVGILDEKLDDFNRKVFQPQIDGSKTGLELPGIVDRGHHHGRHEGRGRPALPRLRLPDAEPLGFPAKDRSAASTGSRSRISAG
jgi:hypothetical protein